MYAILCNLVNGAMITLFLVGVVVFRVFPFLFCLVAEKMEGKDYLGSVENQCDLYGRIYFSTLFPLNLVLSVDFCGENVELEVMGYSMTIQS
jgi:hypothetical protein